ncbi:hypothetical protein [Salegentibacter salegens]|uniref:Uncharacterized protein n=1 Tax=Salegentibacter salegens TaxID=143223 RepID=A0A1M7JIB4_9FLAO|nr:hypothetical protein [Salegentibacter salegens]PRX40635.1 hypothetical protein LY58_03139 [Salegentibacter salegens]SHM52764.1 hypothetical protein SAMN05878281_0985 [Salegentibacter salegens]
MRLINLQRTDDAYVAKAEITLKAFGVALGQRSKIYIRRESENAWREKKTNKKVSQKENAHLNKWLSDHQKFVEH